MPIGKITYDLISYKKYYLYLHLLHSNMISNVAPLV